VSVGPPKDLRAQYAFADFFIFLAREGIRPKEMRVYMPLADVRVLGRLFGVDDELVTLEVCYQGPCGVVRFVGEP